MDEEGFKDGEYGIRLHSMGIKKRRDFWQWGCVLGRD